MFNQLKDQGFMVLAFPCNQFGGQQNGTLQEIKQFVEKNFGSKFPILQKIQVNGPNTHPLYSFLKNNLDPKVGDISWNFAKFIVDRNGNVTKFGQPKQSPETFRALIEKLLEN